MPWYRQPHWRILIALVLGLVYGVVAAYAGWGDFTADWIAPFGTIFLRLLLLVAVPLVLAAAMTVAAAAVLGLPFNLANVIVLPLLFGLGVAGGIHLVAREREVYDSFGRRRTVPVRTYRDRSGFVLSPRFIFIDGETGTQFIPG